jgi:hypothetical protein
LAKRTSPFSYGPHSGDIVSTTSAGRNHPRKTCTLDPDIYLCKYNLMTAMPSFGCGSVRLARKPLKNHGGVEEMR